MGAEIDGVGSSTHRGRTASSRAACGRSTHRVVPDRVEAATYLAALGVAGGELTVHDARAAHMEMLLAKLDEMGMTVTDTGDGLWASAPGAGCARWTWPRCRIPAWPPTTSRCVTAMLAVADGVGIVTENLFAGRFRYVEELARMGADIRTDGHHAVVRGVAAPVGAPVRAHDIRAGAALVVAGLAADGETVISGAHHIDRGYDDIVGQAARRVGADIERAPRRPVAMAWLRVRLGRRCRPVRRRRLGRPPFGPVAAAARSPAIGPSTISISSQPPWWAKTIDLTPRGGRRTPSRSLWLSTSKSPALSAGELELRLHAGRHLLLEVVAVDVVVLVAVGDQPQHDVVAERRRSRRVTPTVAASSTPTCTMISFGAGDLAR